MTSGPVLVIWRDAWFELDLEGSPEGWPEDCLVHTVGWVVHETDRAVYLASERLTRGTGSWRAITCLPRALIVSAGPAARRR